MKIRNRIPDFHNMGAAKMVLPHALKPFSLNALATTHNDDMDIAAAEIIGI